MASSNNRDALFADAELPFGHPGRDDTPAEMLFQTDDLQRTIEAPA